VQRNFPLVATCSLQDDIAAPLQELHQQWQQVQAAPVAASGLPHVWLNYKPPFAEPPPVFVPPKPEPGPEPGFMMPSDLQDLPAYQDPQLQVLKYQQQPAQMRLVQFCMYVGKLMS
jgi:hypothetical protein